MNPILEKQIKDILGDINNTNKLPDFLKEISSTYDTYEKSVRKWKNDFEEERTELMEMLQSMDNGVMIIDKSGKLFLANLAAKKMIATTNEQNMIEHFAESFTLIPIREYIQKVLNGESIAVKETDALGKILSLSFVPLEMTPGNFGMIIWINDITEAKMIDRAKNKFIAIASHEMRTPLAIIRGNSELLIEEPSIVQNKDNKESIDTILKNTIRLLEIVNNFLDVHNIENNIKLNLKEDVDVVGVLKTTINDCKTLLKEKNLEIIFDETKILNIPHFTLDRGRLEQILVNIISNAIHYTEKGNITIYLEDAEKEIKIYFKDTGIGINKEDQIDLFKKFGTGKSFIKTKEYGSGLGLYISSFLANMMGIVVKLEESEVGIGSTFSVTLPKTLAIIK